MLRLSEDVFAVPTGATKIMFCDNSLNLQRWLTSFHGVYLNGSAHFSHRNMSQRLSTRRCCSRGGCSREFGPRRGARGAAGLELARHSAVARGPIAYSVDGVSWIYYNYWMTKLKSLKMAAPAVVDMKNVQTRGFDSAKALHMTLALPAKLGVLVTAYLLP